MKKIIYSLMCIFSSMSCLATDTQKTFLLFQALLMGQISASIDEEQNNAPQKETTPFAAPSKKNKKNHAITKIKSVKKNNIRH
ncbi:hypothetical protein Noda2021_05310 [Candidatus Dependentiae bacterium Noda2021]|nr:hypothetical protein Noda2021_05310 [Candidatus Dependentiae bacterium Noda2021]